MGNPCRAGDSHPGSVVAGDSQVAGDRRTYRTCPGVSFPDDPGAGSDVAVVAVELAAVVVAAAAVAHAAVAVVPLASAFSRHLAGVIVAVDVHSSLVAVVWASELAS